MLKCFKNVKNLVHFSHKTLKGLATAKSGCTDYHGVGFEFIIKPISVVSFISADISYFVSEKLEVVCNLHTVSGLTAAKWDFKTVNAQWIRGWLSLIVKS